MLSSLTVSEVLVIECEFSQLELLIQCKKSSFKVRDYSKQTIEIESQNLLMETLKLLICLPFRSALRLSPITRNCL